jgi:hypothetical protein
MRTKTFARFLRKGRGPGEFADVMQIGQFRNDSSVFVKALSGRIFTFML